MNPAITYTTGDLIAVRAARALAFIDDRGVPPQAAYGLITAVSNGHDAVISLAASDAASTTLPGFGIAWRGADGWSMIICGEVVAVIATGESNEPKISVSNLLDRFAIPGGALSVRFCPVEPEPTALGAKRIELVGGAVRAGDVMIDLRAWDSESRLLAAQDQEPDAHLKLLNGSGDSQSDW